MLFSCDSEIKIDNSLTFEENSPISITENSESIITDSGYVKVTIKSPVAKHFIYEDENYIEMPKGINVQFYDTTGNVTSSITSNYAKSNQINMIMVAKHKVIATNSRGQKLFTEKLTWDQKEHIIYTKKNVKVVTDDKTIFGTGLTANENFDNWEIDNPSGDIILNQEDSTQTN